MKKTMLVILTVALMAIPVLQGFAEYDRDAVVKVMRNNMASLGKVRSAIGSQDFHTAATSLWEIASGMQSLLIYTPPQGPKADWDRTMQAVIDTAYRGIGACGDKKTEALSTTVTELQALMGQGHAAHK